MQIIKWIDDYRSSFAVVVECKGKSYLVIDDSYHVLIYTSDREGVISEYPEICKIEGKMSVSYTHLTLPTIYSV